MKMRLNYGLDNWVLNSGMLSEGDMLAWIEDEVEVHAEYLGTPNCSDQFLIVVERIGAECVDLLNLTDYIVYRIRSSEHVECECGAKYTFNPRYHLSFCPADQK